jgi:molybdate transport system ATP-binding protein
MSTLLLKTACTGDGGFVLSLDCELPGSGVTAICGPSGSGKTTLLECIAGLRDPGPGAKLRFNGSDWYGNGSDIPAWQRGVGYVFSDARLFPHLDVAANLQYALRRAHGNNSPDTDSIVQWLSLAPLLTQMPDTLSAGQRQRVAIARALLRAPQMLLLDEPLANLDGAARDECLGCLQRVAAELDTAMLYVSHNIEEVAQLADHLLLLEHGRAVGQGPLIELCSRLDTRLSHEENAAAILQARVSGHDEEFGLSRLAVEGETLLVNRLCDQPGTSRRVLIPARDVSLCLQKPTDSSILNILPVTVAEMERGDGPRVMLRLALGSQFLLARITRKSAAALQLAEGDSVFAQIKSAALLSEAADQSE